MNGDVLAFGRTVLDHGLGPYREFAFDCRFIIDQEMNGTCILVFCHLYGEFAAGWAAGGVDQAAMVKQMRNSVARHIEARNRIGPPPIDLDR